MGYRINRRTFMQGAAAGAAGVIGAPYISPVNAKNKKPIVLGLTISETAAHGVADHQDHWRGTVLAAEEINAAGGILGRPLELRKVDVDLLNAESCQTAIRRLVDMEVHAISSPFLFVPIPAMDASVGYKCPYLHGNTQRHATDHVAAHPDRYSHIFQTDPSECFYGYTFPVFLTDLEKTGRWTPKNRGVHIVQEQVAYNQTISKACQSVLNKTCDSALGPQDCAKAVERSGDWELAAVTDIQYPVQNWAPVIQDIKRVDAGVVMIDHWVAHEYAAFCKQFRVNPLQDSLVYLQYGPSQPEFLDLAGQYANGFVWSTVLGVYADEKGMEFRRKYKKRWPDTIMGLVYTGNGYDIAYYMKAAWEATGNPDDFKANEDWIRKNPFRGVCGWSYMDNPRQEARHYPVGTDDIENGMSQLYFQVQDVEHKIIYPFGLKQTEFEPAPWMA